MEEQKDNKEIYINGIATTENVLEKIRKQIQFYFSLAQLISNNSLREQIASNSKGWAKIQRIAQYSQLKKILIQQFDGKLKGKNIHKIVNKALQTSQYLKSSFDRIKFRKHLSWQKQGKRLLYFQSTLVTLQHLCSILEQQQGISSLDIFTRKGNNWFFIDFYKMQGRDVQKIYERLQQMICNQQLIGLKIMKINQFLKIKEQYDSLFKQGENQPKTIVRYKMIPRQKMNFDDPQMIKSITIASQDKTKETKNHDLPKKYLSTRNPQAKMNYEMLRARKIEQWRLKKLSRQKQRDQEKMEAQMQEVAQIIQSERNAY